MWTKLFFDMELSENMKIVNINRVLKRVHYKRCSDTERAFEEIKEIYKLVLLVIVIAYLFK